MEHLNGSAHPGDVDAKRPLVFQIGKVRVSIPVSNKPDEWAVADTLREEFLHTTDIQQTVGIEDELDGDSQAQVELVAKLLAFTATKIESNTIPNCVVILANIFNYFTNAYLATADVHTLASAYDTAVRKDVLTGYYLALSTLESLQVTDIPRPPPSALLDAVASSKASLYALFGGQGTNAVYFEELQALYDTYKPYVHSYLKTITNEVLIPLATKAEKDGFGFYRYGLDILSWLTESTPRPSVDYLASVPVSFPVMGVTQLIQYLISIRVSNKSVGEFRSLVAGATGHSQGLVSAAVISVSGTLEEFLQNSIKATKWLFYMGLRGQEAFPSVAIDQAIVLDSNEGGEGHPTPMLSINGLGIKELEKYISKTNAHLPANSKLYVSLHNGVKAFVVTGPPVALYGLVVSLRKVRAAQGLDQSKVPFSQRKPVFSMRFLMVSVPYHSPYLRGATDKVMVDLGGQELWTPEQLAIPVYHTENGADLRSTTDSLTRSLCDQIFTQPIHWDKATDFPPTATHAVDFGPGGTSGIGTLTGRSLQGRGVRVIIIGQKGEGGAELYRAQTVTYEDSWEKKFAPRLVKTSDGKIHIDTPFSRILSKPPIMVAGMTPSTVKAGFVSAILDAGYHVELAGGGHYNPAALRSKVAEIQKAIPPGVGLTLNSLYINPRQFNFQLPLWQEMRREGLPIEGFCVAAGIPTTEKAAEIISGLAQAGIKHVSFKPGSVDGIRQVVNIAAANPDFPIILQWTGGRAGGHHSCEDFHQPILATYASIRRQSNIALVAGSGFGGADDFYPYLTGEWSVKRYGVQAMPFDGLLFASRVMVAKEAHTSSSVKDLIVAAPGVEDADWEGTYQKETGGILTVRSELGEPIHKIATRGVRLWKEFDDTVFALPKEKRADWLQQRREYVISKLNKDFSKPWFAQKKDGTVVYNLGDMTYEEVTLRMVRLMYVAHQSRWVDVSLRNLLGDWLRRIEERFAGVDKVPKASILQSYSSLDDPQPVIESFFSKYSQATEQLLSSEDIAYFLAISQRPGQKPVPFIPILNADFEVWFKKDSLWAAEDIEAVFDQDPQRVCILQGPVAAKHATKKDEPIGELLGNVESSLVAKILEQYYDNDSNKVPAVDFLDHASNDTAVESIENVEVKSDATSKTYNIAGTLPDASAWLDLLSGPSPSWLRAFLVSTVIVQGTSYVNNPMRRIFTPRVNQSVVTQYEDQRPTSVAIYGGARSYGPHKPGFKSLELSYDASTQRINLTLFEDRQDVAVPLSLEFQYRPDQGFAPIHEIVENRNRKVKGFYWNLWFEGAQLPEVDIRATYTSPETVIDVQTVEKFCSVVENHNESFSSTRQAVVQAPMDFAIVVGWRAIMQAIFPDVIDGDLLRLVHLSNAFRMIPGARLLQVGDVCQSKARIVAVTNTDSGKVVNVKGTVFRNGEPVIEVTSAFLYRGRFIDFPNTFETVEESDYAVELRTATDVGVLQSKEWFEWDDSSKPLLPGTTLIFKTQSEYTYKDKKVFAAVNVNGAAYVKTHMKQLLKVATVANVAENANGNAVLGYLKRHGGPLGNAVMFENGGYTLTSSQQPSVINAPLTNEPYSKISGDFNPIHINPYFADYAGLPGTITHGLWTSAATRKYIESTIARGRPERVLSYDVSFVGMVLPGDRLEVKLKHIGMKDGNLVIRVETSNDRGDKVIEGTAEVAQPTTAYVFTGQGSQEPGMGMDLYNSSPAAREVWDTADAHLRAVYGFSIIDIVKNNPKSKTIHFGGLKGQEIRQRYMEMSYDTMDKDSNVKTLPLFADIDIRTPAYTFSHPNGLLFATQFAQIALVVTEKAAFEDMRSHGLVPPSCAFAGHSLGEYSALASIAGVLPISSLVDIVFYRGITMQRAVERDSQNRSNYAMCAVNPSRVSKTFNDAALREVVDCISTKGNILLEIVNFNVEGQQYVCAGELVALQCLTNVLNYLKVEKVDIAKLTEKLSVEKVREMLAEIVDECLRRALEQQKAEEYIHLERGYATIPLPGIDVPFHSRYLWAGVMPFRAYLSKKVNPSQLDPDTLVGKYIPNLTAEPFEVSREYAQRVYDQTSSPRLDKVLRHWDRDSWGSPEQRQKLAYIILVELLSYQFASAVRWIETQDRLFTEFHFERLIELGPGPTLTGMATRTWKAKYEAADDALGRTRVIYCHAKNTKDIYYQYEDEPEAVEDVADAPESTSAPAPGPVPVSVVPTNVPSQAAAVAIPDEPLKASDTLRFIIAQKLKKKVEEIPMSKSIKDLVGGKSTLQNEILGDLQLEFASAPEKGEEMPLEELGSSLSAGYSGTPGKHTSGLISRMVGAKMPGGFNISSIKSHLSKTWGLGPMRSDGLLLFSLPSEPVKRLGSEQEAKAWLDSIAGAYAQFSGISLSTSSSGGGGASGGSGAVMNSEEFLKFRDEQHDFAAQQIEVYMRYLGKDSRSGERSHDQAKTELLELQNKLDRITREHGDVYIDGVQPMFEPLKARHFDSSWNWVRQDALLMWYDIIHGRLTTVDREITARCISIMNRADPVLLEYMQYHIDACDPNRGETYRLAKEFGQQLIDNCREALGQPPCYKDVTFPTAPKTEVSSSGDVVYSEVMRENVRKLEAYVEEMASGGAITGAINIQKVQDDVLKLWNVVKSQPGISQEQKGKIKALYEGVVRSLRKGPEPRHRVGARNRRSSSQFLRPQITTGSTSLSADKIPLLHLKRRVGNQWEYSGNLTSVYLDVLTEIATSGTTFKDKNALLTGVGKGSIGVEVLKGLLSGGAHVVVTTSRYSRSTVEYYQDIYQKFGARGSALTVVPFNQGSKQDVEALVDYIYATLSLDLDYILPFAAVPENGREIDGLDDKSELAHRIMLVNLLRLLGAVKTKKASRQFVTRPTQVILPLSPNHGLFGSDGLYSESKISLETLFNRWNSESWGEYLCLAGAVIGWTRGTGVMVQTNIIAQQVESHGVRTFSAKEMAFNLLGLMHPLLFSITQVEPIWADLNGGMDRLPDLADITRRIRTSINQQADLRRAITRDNAADFKIAHSADEERVLQDVSVTPRANFKFEFPHLENKDALEQLSQLRGLIDLEQVVVLTGFAEVGPWGSSRTRWEMEARGEFTIEGCIEMAWMMGYIKHFDGKLKNGTLYVGWVDAKSGDPVDDKDIKGKYEQEILAHSGVRLIEPEINNDYDPEKKVFYQEIELTHDLEPIEVAEADANKFKLQHGDKCDIWTKEGQQAFVKFKKGAIIKVPKAFRFSTLVAGQLPTGWYAGRYGIPEDIVAQTDRTALWALVCAAEALNMSGITDPYELYKYVHPSEVGSSIGSGMGGMTSLQAMFIDRREELEVQNDVLQETFINTVAGWVNMLLLSSSGPIKIPVGACATALQSLDIACDTILGGKAKVMLAGGFDDFSEQGSYEFANMKATSNTLKEFAAGREPTEFSRPTTSTRAGFMESQGCGVQVVMNAKLAVELGLPIRAVLAYTSTSSDKAGRSVPAPGKGVLTIGRQASEAVSPSILDIKYRSRQLAFRRKQISDWMANEHEMLKEEVTLLRQAGQEPDETYISSRQADLENEARRQEKQAQATYGLLRDADSRIAPLRRALAVWGLSADDLGVISIHGTSTMANEANETHVYNDIFTNIGRTRGNAIPVMAQKSLTGHAKGGSAAWQMIGLCQTVDSGIVPGNRNADNVDKELRQWEYLMFPSKSIYTDGIKAGLMTSFGFGQVGGSALIVHPKYLLASLEPNVYEAYKVRNRSRALACYKVMTEMMTTNTLVKVKAAPPYTPDLEMPVLLNPLARAELDKTGSYSFPKKLPKARSLDESNAKAIASVLDSQNSPIGVGVDHELISAVPSSNPTFLTRNFTPAEITYCQAQPAPDASFAARWAGKEAVFKALGVPSKGAGAAMIDIEILPNEAGVPCVTLHGAAKEAADHKNIKTVNISLSHSQDVAIAFATAQ